MDIKSMYKRIMEDDFPDDLTIKLGHQTLTYKKRTWKIPDEKTGFLVEKGLRYGENPDQQAALYELTNGNIELAGCSYIEPGNGLVSSLSEHEMLSFGKHPGKTNLTDLDNALNILKYLTERPAAVILKHNNPCGAAYGDNIFIAYDRANMADRIAAFGGCLVLNRPVDKETAESIAANYLEVVAAPDYEEDAFDILAKRKNLRIVRMEKIDRLSSYRGKRFIEIKSLIDGGLILQQSQTNTVNTGDDLKLASTIYQGKEYVIQRKPTEKEIEDMLFGWSVELGITSNSVIYVKDCVTIGIGTGEQDRVGVAEIAAYKAYTKYADALCFREFGIPYKTYEVEAKAGKRDIQALREIDKKTEADKGGIKGSIMISDAFFPFRDGVEVGIGHGVTGIVQAGGSERDFETIEACNEASPQVTMVFTGQRVFRH